MGDIGTDAAPELTDLLRGVCTRRYNIPFHEAVNKTDTEIEYDKTHEIFRKQCTEPADIGAGDIRNLKNIYCSAFPGNKL